MAAERAKSSAKLATVSAADAANKELYGADGQYNPKLAKAAKRRSKRLAKTGGDDAFDFDEAFGEEDEEME